MIAATMTAVFRRGCVAAALALAILGVVAPGLGIAQSGARADQETRPGPSFDVASIKPNASDTVSTWKPEPGRFTAVNVTLRRLISYAYGPPREPLPEFLIEGGPRWLATARFDITATAPGATPVDMIPMLRRVVEERFKLRTHVETRQQRVYALSLARTDGSFGPGMRRTSLDCAGLAAGRTAGEPCGAGLLGLGTLTARGVTPTQMISGLARLMPDVGRVVIDRTGLAGEFDIELTWTPDQIPVDAGRTSTPDPDGPSLFTAIRDQWGLKLEPATGPVAVLVIDAVSPLTEN